MDPMQMSVVKFMKALNNSKFHIGVVTSGRCCLQPAVYNLIGFSVCNVPPMSVKIHSFKSTCSVHCHATIQHHITQHQWSNLSMEVKFCLQLLSQDHHCSLFIESFELPMKRNRLAYSMHFVTFNSELIHMFKTTVVIIGASRSSLNS